MSLGAGTKGWRVSWRHALVSPVSSWSRGKGVWLKKRDEKGKKIFLSGRFLLDKKPLSGV